MEKSNKKYVLIGGLIVGLATAGIAAYLISQKKKVEQGKEEKKDESGK